MTGKEPLLSAENLVVRYRSHNREAVAVKHVSFDIAPGETLGIVGESGSGKSTIALAIMKLLPRTSTVEGQIKVSGTEVVSADAHVMNTIRGTTVGLVYQDALTALNPVRTIGSQIAEVCRYQLGLSTREAYQTSLSVLSDVGIGDPELRYKQYPHEFSGGMRQRAAIAMALAARPKLLIADEPTTALDVTVKAQILRLLQDLKAKHAMSMMIISHDLEVIREVSDRVAVMYAGRIVEIGERPEVLASPRHPYTRDLIRSAPSVEMPRISFIPGSPPDTGAIITGCAFEPRCSVGHGKPNCRAILPDLNGGPQAAACHYPLEASTKPMPGNPVGPNSSIRLHTKEL